MKNLCLYIILMICVSANCYGVAIAENCMSDFPKIMLWAWERPEDLRFINPEKIGVAFLAKTIYLQKEKAIIRPRLQPLIIADKAFCIAVIRIESNGFEPSSFPKDQTEKAISSIIKLCGISWVRGIQIDFDAKSSERGYYREFLLSLRNRMPEKMPLSMTALASWCIYDNWISDLPVDEAVPMLFRMGVDQNQVKIYLESGNDFKPLISKNSLGLSIDEPFPNISLDRRIYIFNPRSWSKDDLSKILKEIDR